jgi:hypothetical protein
VSTQGRIAEMSFAAGVEGVLVNGSSPLSFVERNVLLIVGACCGCPGLIAALVSLTDCIKISNCSC